MVAISLLARTHFLAIICAALLALLIASPLYLIPRALGEHYQGINIMEFGNDEHLYLSRGKEALEGKSLGQPFLAEWKDSSEPTRSFTERILVAPVRFFGLQEKIDIVTYFNVLNTVGVFVLVLAMYAFALRLSGNTWLALGSALFAIGGYTIIEAKTFFYEGLNIYGRSLYPYASSVPFFIFLSLVYDAVIRERGWRYALAAGALLGLMCYLYFYAWTFSLALLGSLGIIFLALREWRSFWISVSIGLTGVALGAYNIYQMLASIYGPMAAQISFYYYSVKSHAPVMSKIGAATAGLLAFVFWRGVRDRGLIFIVAVIAAGWISLNQQIITGRLLQYGHYYWYFIVPLGVIIGGALLARVIPERFIRYLGIALLALAFLNLLGQQTRSIENILPVKLHEQDYAPILETLKQKPYGVVLTDAGADGYATLVTIYTHHDLYWVPSAEVHTFPIERLKEALLVHLFLNPAAREDPATYLQDAVSEYAKDRSAFSEYVYLYFELEGFNSGLEYYAYTEAFFGGQSFSELRDRLMREIGQEYEARFKNAEDVKALLQERGVRYILWDSSLYPEWDLSVFSDLKEVARNESVVLYEFATGSAE